MYAPNAAMNHFTDKDGFDGIRSQVDWTFRAVQPRALHNPRGAYFTTWGPNEPNLAKKIFVPRAKLAYRFEFTQPSPLKNYPGGRGRLKCVFYSPEDYVVPNDYQIFQGVTGL